MQNHERPPFYAPELASDSNREAVIRKDIRDFWPNDIQDPKEYLRQLAQWGRAMKGHLQSGIGALRALTIGTVPQVRIEHGLGNKITLETKTRAVYTLEYQDGDDSLAVFQNGQRLSESDIQRLSGELSAATQAVNTETVRLRQG